MGPVLTLAGSLVEPGAPAGSHMVYVHYRGAYHRGIWLEPVGEKTFHATEGEALQRLNGIRRAAALRPVDRLEIVRP